MRDGNKNGRVYPCQIGVVVNWSEQWKWLRMARNVSIERSV